jgi:hypothetical protein
MSGIPVINPNDSQAVASHTKVENDVHQGVTRVVGPLIFADNNILGNTYLVRGWVDEANSGVKNSVQIYVSAKFDHWAFLDSAYSYGDQLNTTVIDRDVNCGRYSCTHTETVGVDLRLNQLERVAKDGFSFKVRGSGGSVIMSIPAAYFAGFREVYLRVSLHEGSAAINPDRM